MKTQIIKQIFFWCIVISLNASCTSITKLFPKEPRPFQAKESNSAEWKSGQKVKVTGTLVFNFEGE